MKLATLCTHTCNRMEYFCSGYGADCDRYVISMCIQDHGHWPEYISLT